MEISKLDHIGIAVKSIEESLKFYEGTLGITCLGQEEVRDQKVITAFLPLGETEVELLQSTSEDGTIAKFVEKRGEGLHHLAFKVDDIEKALEELKSQGIILIDEKPSIGAGGAKIAFIHPKSANGILIEIIERE